MPQRPTRSTLFPYTTLFRSENWQEINQAIELLNQLRQEQKDFENVFLNEVNEEGRPYGAAELVSLYHFAKRDRKSTRLNSSHVAMSYAVFCLKKKNFRMVMQ